MKTFFWIVGSIVTLGALWLLAKSTGFIPKVQQLVSASPNQPSGGAAQANPPNTGWSLASLFAPPTAPIVPGSTPNNTQGQTSNQSGDLLSNLLTPSGINTVLTGLGSLFNGGNSSLSPSNTYSTGGNIDTPALYYPDNSNNFFDGTLSGGPLTGGSYDSGSGGFSLI